MSLSTAFHRKASGRRLAGMFTHYLLIAVARARVGEIGITPEHPCTTGCRHSRPSIQRFGSSSAIPMNVECRAFGSFL